MLTYKLIPTSDLIPYARNSRTHSEAQVTKIASSIKEFGFINPVVTDGKNGIVAGHGRVLAASKLGLKEVPCVEASHLTEAQKRAYVIADNRMALDAGWDFDLLKVELGDLQGMDFDLALTGFDPGELENFLAEEESTTDNSENSKAGNLSDKFLVSPFSVLNAREGWWQDRKRKWLSLGLKSEVGRGESLTFSQGDDFAGKLMSEMGATSIFDPVLTEIAYSWFSPLGGLILDPFAGGSVRGVVASKLGRQYIGHELRPEQVKANRVQGDGICSDPMPVWIEGDSRLIDKTCTDVEADMVFSCPPYADLEVYSNDPADLSNMNYKDFVASYREIIAKACARLKNDRFACFVVGEVRDKKGNYIDFVGDTIQAFRDAGLSYYNEAILITMCGSVSIRAGRQFSASRKLGKTHQNVLVFVKGDGKKAASACGIVEVHIQDVENSDLGEEL
jgi:hypothetical protein